MTVRPGAAGRGEPMPASLRAATARTLEEQFPGVRVWYGEATGSWWAMVVPRKGPRLLEAPSPQELRDEIMNIRTRG